MSPTYFVVQMERINRAIDEARRVSDIQSLQKLASEATSLLRSMYGNPQ